MAFEKQTESVRIATLTTLNHFAIVAFQHHADSTMLRRNRLIVSSHFLMKVSLRSEKQRCYFGAGRSGFRTNVQSEARFIFFLHMTVSDPLKRHLPSLLSCLELSESEQQVRE